MFASLPMYDLPQLSRAHERLWSALRDQLASMGFAAPLTLTRSGDHHADWLVPDLLLSQTCGLPYVRDLRGRVRLVAAVDYALPDCRPGNYCSRIIVHRDSAAAQLSDLRGAHAAINAPNSQSGAGALRHAVLPLLDAKDRFFSQVSVTGAHLASVRAVAQGDADLAAIDAVTFALAQRHLPEAEAVRVLASTEETPGLPLITALSGPAPVLADALARAIADIGPEAREVLMIRGLVPRSDADFDVIAAWDAEAKARGYCELG